MQGTIACFLFFGSFLFLCLANKGKEMNIKNDTDNMNYVTNCLTCTAMTGFAVILTKGTGEG